MRKFLFCAALLLSVSSLVHAHALSDYADVAPVVQPSSPSTNSTFPVSFRRDRLWVSTEDHADQH